MNTLHTKIGHPSKAQLTSLVRRYFYTTGWRESIDEILMQCHQCAILRELPKMLIEDTTTIPDRIGTHLAADVIERALQKIFIVRDKLTQFTHETMIRNQTADTLRQALLNLILDINFKFLQHQISLTSYFFNFKFLQLQISSI